MVKTQAPGCPQPPSGGRTRPPGRRWGLPAGGSSRGHKGWIASDFDRPHGSERCAGPGRRSPRKPPSDGLEGRRTSSLLRVPLGVPPRKSPFPSFGLSPGRPPPNDLHREVAVLMVGTLHKGCRNRGDKGLQSGCPAGSRAAPAIRRSECGRYLPPGARSWPPGATRPTSPTAFGARPRRAACRSGDPPDAADRTGPRAHRHATGGADGPSAHAAFQCPGDREPRH